MIAARRPNAEAERRDTPVGATLDFHRSPVEAARCFLATEYLTLRSFQFIHELACGDGALVLPLREAGVQVIASDIADRGCPRSHVQDFLDPGFGTKTEAQRRRIAAFTNPPFNRAGEFIIKACAQYDYVAMILRLRYLGSKHLVDEQGRSHVGGKKVADGKPIWQRTRLPFARVIVPKSRWPLMHRDDFEGERTNSSTIDFGIFVWEAAHRGSPQIIREPDNRYIADFKPTEGNQP